MQKSGSSGIRRSIGSCVPHRSFLFGDGLMSKTISTLPHIGEPESTQDSPCRNTTPAKRRRVPLAKSPKAPSKKVKYNMCITHHLHNVEVRYMDTEITKFLDEQENEVRKATAALQAELADRESLDQLIREQKSKTKAVEDLRKELHTLESGAGGGQHRASGVDIGGLSEKVDMTGIKDVTQGQSNALRDALQQLEAAKEQIKDCKDQISAFSTAHAKHLEEKETTTRQQDEEKTKQACMSLELELSKYKSKLKSDTEMSNQTIQSWKDTAARAREDTVKAIKANNLEAERKRLAQDAEKELRIKLEANKRQYESALTAQRRETRSLQSKLNAAEYDLSKKSLAIDEEVHKKLEAAKTHYEALLTKQKKETEALQLTADDYSFEIWYNTTQVKELKEEK